MLPFIFNFNKKIQDIKEFNNRIMGLFVSSCSILIITFSYMIAEINWQWIPGKYYLELFKKGVCQWIYHQISLFWNYNSQSVLIITNKRSLFWPQCQIFISSTVFNWCQIKGRILPLRLGLISICFGVNMGRGTQMLGNCD